MYKSYSMELAGRTLTVDIGRVAAQANGAVFIKYGDTTVLSTATASDKPRDGVDFFPLSVEFEEKMYSVGKIPGGFNKREGKASENAILTDRVIDRPMRPLFPKDYRNDVTLNNLVMSVPVIWHCCQTQVQTRIPRTCPGDSCYYWNAKYRYSLPTSFRLAFRSSWTRNPLSVMTI